MKILFIGIMQSPSGVLTEIRRRLFPVPQNEETSQVQRIRELTHEAPLILQIETVNTCNAACKFCAYKSMKRKKGVMSMPLFRKVVSDYAAMGGGPVSLTPVGGDALLDPHLIDRLRILEDNSKINQVSLTTNAIALERYSDEEVCYLLKTLACIQVSIGGLDPTTYKTLYAVDRFDKVQKALERLLKLKGLISQPANITFAFRTNDWRFERRFRRKINEYRKQGVFISHVWMYANYAGLVKSDEKKNLVVLDSPAKTKTPANCIYGCISMAVCWDGRITACGCADIEADALPIGNAGTDSLADVWSGTRRLEILDSFMKGTPAEICRKCSAFQPDTTAFPRRYFKKFNAHEPLPIDFYREFWGG